MLKQVQKGFTLIELMIVVAIIGILAAIAIPAYQDYVVRSQVSEALAMAGAAKASVAEFYANRGAWPADNDEAGMGAASDIKGKYVDQITVDNGGITIRFGGDVNQKISGATLGLSPAASPNDDVVWKCGRADFASGSTDGGASAATDGTTSDTLLNKYLPSSCRGS